MGDIKIHKDVLLKDVLYVPCFKYNLISVNKLIQDMHCEVVFTTDKCVLQGTLMKMSLLLGKARSKLYYLHNDISKNIKASRHAAHTSQNNPDGQKLHKLKLWHIRLGHLPFNKIQIIFPELKGKESDESCFCTICPLARQTRSSFSKKNKDTESVFQLMHIDVWGPIRHATRTHCNSFITIVDDYSRFTWVFLIKHKSDFLHYFKQFYEFVLTRFNTKIK